MLAMNPNNADHFIYTKPPMTYQSMDGGATYESLNHSNIFHAGIDRKGALTRLIQLTIGGMPRTVPASALPLPGVVRPHALHAQFNA